MDEVDYMTKNAQQALRYLIQQYSKNVRFCLICNYISRIDDSLQNEFVRLRFNQLPKYEIINFLKKININENLYLTDKQIESIQSNYKSDIRSMINYMQSNQLAIKNTKVMSHDIFNIITDLINNKKYKLFNIEINKITSIYNIDVKSIIISYFNYIIRNKQENITPTLLNIIETIIHNSESNINDIIKYFFYSLSTGTM